MHTAMLAVIGRPGKLGSGNHVLISLAKFTRIILWTHKMLKSPSILLLLSLLVLFLSSCVHSFSQIYTTKLSPMLVFLAN